MESYLVDQTVLGEVVDALISEKYPGQPAAAYAGIREEAIKSLDHQILKAILGHLTKDQGQELNQLLDKNSSEDADPAVFEDFFNRCSVNLEEVLRETMVKFRDDFLGNEREGGENA